MTSLVHLFALPNVWRGVTASVGIEEPSKNGEAAVYVLDSRNGVDNMLAQVTVKLHEDPIGIETLLGEIHRKHNIFTRFYSTKYNDAGVPERQQLSWEQRARCLTRVATGSDKEPWQSYLSFTTAGRIRACFDPNFVMPSDWPPVFEGSAGPIHGDQLLPTGFSKGIRDHVNNSFLWQRQGDADSGNRTMHLLKKRTPQDSTAVRFFVTVEPAKMRIEEIKDMQRLLPPRVKEVPTLTTIDSTQNWSPGAAMQQINRLTRDETKEK